MILSTFSYTCWPFIYNLWENISLGHLPNFTQTFLYWVVWFPYIFWKLIACYIHSLQRFSPIPQVTCLFCWLFLLLCKMFCFVVPFVDFCFCYLCFYNISKIITTTNAKELFLIFSPGSFMVSGNSKRTRNRKGTWIPECIFAISW